MHGGYTCADLPNSGTLVLVTSGINPATSPSRVLITGDNTGNVESAPSTGFKRSGDLSHPLQLDVTSDGTHNRLGSRDL